MATQSLQQPQLGSFQTCITGIFLGLLAWADQATLARAAAAAIKVVRRVSVFFMVMS
jgi:hypothetical protein